VKVHTSAKCWLFTRSTAIYRASGNRYFPFAHGPLNLSTPVSKSVTPGWPTCPLRTASNRCSAHCRRHAGSRDACGTTVCRSTAEVWHFFSRSKVHESPKYGGDPLFPHCTLDLHEYCRFGRFVGVANLFLGQSIGIDETNTFQLKYCSSLKIVGATRLGGLWAWHIRVTNLHCAQGYEI